MAFQAGTRIRPELANADFSGFANAASIRANALANLGATIGSAIKKHKVNKEEKLFNDNVDDFLSTTSQKETKFGESLRELGITGKESARVARKALGDDLVPLLKMFMSAGDEPVKPVSPGVTKAAAAMAEEAGFVYNEETGNMEREVQTGEPSFMGMIKNKFFPGQPYTPTETVTMPQEIIEGTTGMSEAIRNKRLMKDQERMASDPLGLGL
tara:strand:+ start:59 stop:697 length:639 start_codon:yes stop_codon:yes gene_type:complete